MTDLSLIGFLACSGRACQAIQRCYQREARFRVDSAPRQPIATTSSQNFSTLHKFFFIYSAEYVLRDFIELLLVKRQRNGELLWV
jgi:hypothetical protein